MIVKVSPNLPLKTLEVFEGMTAEVTAVMPDGIYLDVNP